MTKLSEVKLEVKLEVKMEVIKGQFNYADSIQNYRPANLLA